MQSSGEPRGVARLLPKVARAPPSLLPVGGGRGGRGGEEGREEKENEGGAWMEKCECGEKGRGPVPLTAQAVE